MQSSPLLIATIRRSYAFQFPFDGRFRIEPDTDAAITSRKGDEHARLKAVAEQQMGCDRPLLIEHVENAAFLDLKLQGRRIGGAAHGRRDDRGE